MKWLKQVNSAAAKNESINQMQTLIQTQLSAQDLQASFSK